MKKIIEFKKYFFGIFTAFLCIYSTCGQNRTRGNTVPGGAKENKAIKMPLIMKNLVEFFMHHNCIKIHYTLLIMIFF